MMIYSSSFTLLPLFYSMIQVGSERMRIEVIGQRLLTGRLAIAEAALVSARCLLMKTEQYANEKVCNGLTGEVTVYIEVFFLSS